MTALLDAGRPAALSGWDPEDEEFWARGGARIARRNLVFSVLSEHVGFSVWSLWSVLVLFLGPEYHVDTAGKFTLTALPTALGAVLRLPYAFAVARFGGRTWTAVSTLLLLVPTALAAVVLEPGVPYGTLLAVACAAGVGGGNFASSMANINAFYPHRLKGWALGVNAGGGNLGVPAVQLLGLLVMATAGAAHPRLLPLLYLPVVVLVAAGAWRRMDDLPLPSGGGARALREVARDPYGWAVCALYVGTFGSFIGFGFAFGQVLQVQFHDRFDTPAKAAALTFLGPLLGSLLRPVGGRLADRFGGARVTLGTFAAMGAGAAAVLAASRAGSLPLFLAAFVVLFVLSGIGNGSTYKLIPAHYRAVARRAVAAGADPEAAEAGSRRRAGALIGLAGAVGAFGGVLVNLAFRQSFLAGLGGEPAYLGFLAAYLFCSVLTWAVWLRRRRAGAHG